MGILTFVFAAVLFIAGFVYPDIYKALEMPNSEIHVEFERKEAQYEGGKSFDDDGGDDSLEKSQEEAQHEVAAEEQVNEAEA